MWGASIALAFRRLALDHSGNARAATWSSRQTAECASDARVLTGGEALHHTRRPSSEHRMFLSQALRKCHSARLHCTPFQLRSGVFVRIGGGEDSAADGAGSHKIEQAIAVPPGKRRHASTRSRDRRTRPIELFDDTCLIVRVLSEAKGPAVQRGRQTPCRPSRPSGRCRPGTVSLCVGHRTRCHADGAADCQFRLSGLPQRAAFS